MTFTFDDPRGFQDLDVVNVLINGALDGGLACYLAYSRPLNTLYLVDDTGGGLLPGIAMNGSGSISNSACPTRVFTSCRAAITTWRRRTPLWWRR